MVALSSLANLAKLDEELYSALIIITRVEALRRMLFKANLAEVCSSLTHERFTLI